MSIALRNKPEYIANIGMWRFAFVNPLAGDPMILGSFLTLLSLSLIPTYW